MKAIKFLNNPQSFNSETDFVVHLRGIKNKNELFKQLSIKLQLPEYFGFNWDALHECLRDFSWIKNQKIIIVHDDIPKLNENELSTYLEVLFDAVIDWKEGEVKSLEVVFPENIK